MGSVYFQSRKYEGDIDCTFHIYDGNEIASLGNFRVGDEVSLLFHVSLEMFESIHRLNVPGFKAYVDSSRGRDFSGTAHIPFTVIKRSHACSWQRVGTLRLLSESVTLQAQSGYWEDLFLWICLGVVPEWGQVEQEEESDRT